MRKPKETVSDIDYLMDEWDAEANEANGIFPEKLGSQSNIYAFWKCAYGHKWKAKINNRYNGQGCPECRKRLHTSFPEQAVLFYVKKVYPDAVNSYKDIFSNKMELDIYIPSIKTGIEYDGIAWHNNATLKKEQKKYSICKEHGIRLIRLREKMPSSNDSLLISDIMLPVNRPFAGKSFNYPVLDRVIIDLLYILGDVDYTHFNMSSFLNITNDKTGLLFRQKVNTDVDSRRDKADIYKNYLSIKKENSFGALFPEVASMWHPTKNGDLTPFMFSPHTTSEMWWLGKCGHEWETTINLMTRGCGCPYCHGLRVLKGFNDLKSTYPDIAAQWHPTKNGTASPDMFTYGSDHKAYWLCPVCKQTWKSAINNRTTNHRGCPFCAHIKPVKGKNDLQTLFPHLMLEWDYEKNIGLAPAELLPSSNKQAWWKCAICGYRYKASISSRTKGSGCKRCAGQVLIPGQNDLESQNPEIASEFAVEENGGILPSQVFASSNKIYWWKCKNGHKWRTAPNARARGNGCPYCSGNKVWVGFNDLETTHPEVASMLHPTMNNGLLPTNISKGYKHKVWFKCPVCNNAFDAYIYNMISGKAPCPYCSPRKTRAKCVYQVETGKYYKTLKEAANSVGKNDIRNIQMCCVGKCNTAYGYHWEYRVAPCSNKDENFES